MSLQKMTQKIRSRLGMFIVGGEWALVLPPGDRRNLKNYWFDGLFAAASDTIPINYLTLYLLAVGATSTQVGIYSALTSLAAAACLLPGALLVERYGHRKQITVWFAGGLARIMLLCLALLPLGLTGQMLIWGVVALAILRSAAGNLAFPAWMSLTGDIVPMEGRGRYFGARNLAMVFAGILMTYLVGEFITRVGSLEGYQISLGLAFAVGMASTFFFGRISDHHSKGPVEVPMPISLSSIWRDLHASPTFLYFCLISAMWNFFVNVSAPFFNVYMVENLNFTAAMVGITAIATSFSKIFIQKKVGELSDRWGAGRLQMVSMLVIPILPLMWLFITQLWHVVALNIVGGVMWGTFELVSFNFLLELTPGALRARYAAIYQIIVTLALAGGAAAGSSIILLWGYNGNFLTSAVGRILAALLFMLLIRGLGSSYRAAEEPAGLGAAVE